MTIAIDGLINGLWGRVLMAVAPEYAERKERKERKEREQRFNEALRLYDGLIMRLCFGYARTPAELNDLHQDALVNIWQGMAKFRGESSLKTWIYRVTLNTCVSTIRTRSRSIDSMPIEEVMDTRDDSQESMALVKDIHEAISQLSPTDKAVMLLWLDEMSYDEIASLTGLTKSAVGVRIHRAKDKLKKLI